MITKIFNGKYFYNKILSDLSKNINKNYLLMNFPVLLILLIGNNFSTNSYVKNKIVACEKIYIQYFLFKLSKNVKLQTLIRLILIFNIDKFITGIVIQMPLPFNLNKKQLFESISILKDVDVLNPLNFGNYILGYRNFVAPCVSKSVLFFLNTLNINFKGLHSVILGSSNIVGKPLFFDFLSLGFSCCLVNKYDKKILIKTKTADILVTAIGVPNFFKSDFISFGGIIIDIGINNLDKTCIIGDINMHGMFNKVSWLTPVPGGIGPLTVAALLKNTVILYLYQNKIY